MYGGLFGDLPCAKSSVKKDDETTKEARVQAPPDMTTADVLSGLGNAGTAMEFIPTAIRPRKRHANQSSIKSRSTTATTSVDKAIFVTRSSAPLFVQPSPPTEEVDHHEVPSKKVKSDPLESDLLRNENQSIANQIMDRDYDRCISQGHTAVNALDVCTEVVRIKQEIYSVHTVISNIHEVVGGSQESKTIDHEPGLEDEEQQRLHASVTDPYDPHVPNDLLSFRDRREREKERLNLEREARETLERQEHLRRQLQDERERVQATGRVSDIIEHRTKVSLMGGGRGRGINNLPAWLLRKQQDELATTTSVDDIGARTVILSNLTPPGNVDEELGVEVQEECEELCGPVEGIKIKDAEPPNQPDVRVWVQFRNVEDAKKAATLFHGRMFGQRRITAQLQST